MIEKASEGAKDIRECAQALSSLERKTRLAIDRVRTLGSQTPPPFEGTVNTFIMVLEQDTSQGVKLLADLEKTWKSLRSLWEGQDRAALEQRVPQKDAADSLHNLYYNADNAWQKASMEATNESLPTLQRLNGEEYL